MVHVVETSRHIEAAQAERAHQALLEALYDLLEAAIEVGANDQVIARSDELGELCRDAADLCEALGVIRRRREP